MMTLPNPALVSALFDSYICIRESKWGLNREGSLQLPENNKPAYKLSICQQFLKRIQAAQSLEDWVDIAYELYNQELAENEEARKSSQRYLSMAYFFVDEPLLFKTLRAVRHRMLVDLNAELEFTTVIANLLQKKGQLENTPENGLDSTKRAELEHVKRKLKALEGSIHCPQDYFNNVIKLRESRAIKFKEATLEDYEKNVLSNYRAPIFTDRLTHLTDLNLESSSQSSASLPTDTNEKAASTLNHRPKKLDPKKHPLPAPRISQNPRMMTRAQAKKRAQDSAGDAPGAPSLKP